jgi:hypothetical protein
LFLISNGYTIGDAKLTITVVEPPTFQQRYKDFWDTYGQPISIVAGGFTGETASLLSDRLKKSKEQDTNIDDYRII